MTGVLSTDNCICNEFGYNIRKLRVEFSGNDQKISPTVGPSFFAGIFFSRFCQNLYLRGFNFRAFTKNACYFVLET